jgi:transmembrane channel-like protein
MQYSSHFSVESFPNEERTWEEIMQIKAMPVNMAQKRELKLKLKVCDKIAL